MLRVLESLGLAWDGPVEYQSAHTARYARALGELGRLGLTFECSCPRSALDPEGGGYPGTCRAGATRPGPTAVRFRVGEGEITFTDRAQGLCRYALRERGDVIVRRRDGVYAYQLAVVVDDAAAGITDVVRGADLLDSTPWQIALQRALGLPQPAYLHLPLVTEGAGEKLSKSRRSVALDPGHAGRELVRALALLRQAPPPGLDAEPPGEIVRWAATHWNPGGLRGVRAIGAGD